MYDFNTHSINGINVSYCVLPYHAIDQVAKHETLTSTAKSAYFVLLSYASYKATESFYVTATWISDRLSITRKTASAALSQLKVFGFATDNGIIIPKLDNVSKRRSDKQTDFAQTKLTIKQKRQASAKTLSEQNNKTNITSVTSNPVDSGKPSNNINASVNFVQAQTKEKPPTQVNTNTSIEHKTVNVEQQILSKQNNITNDFVQTKSNDSPVEPNDEQNLLIKEHIQRLEAVFGVGRVPTPMKKGIFDSVMMAVKITNPEVKITTKMGKNYPSHITNLETSNKNNNPVQNVQSVSAQQVLASQLTDTDKQIITASNVVTRLHSSKLQYLNRYIEAALQRMRVGAGQIEVYIDEITYSLTKGAFAQTYIESPMKAVRACLNIIEAGNWRPQAGMY